MIALRPFVAGDYSAVADVINAAAPEYPLSAQELASRDARRPPAMCFARWVVLDPAGGVVGVGEYDQHPDLYHPRKWALNVFVHPTWQRQGVGTRLFELLETELQQRGVLTTRTSTREDRPQDVHFLTRRGYRAVMQDGGAVLDLNDIDVAEAASQEAKARTQGVVLRSLPELASDPDRDQKLCELHNALIADIPPLGERTPLDVETFVTLRLQRPDLIPEAFLVAVDVDGAYIGMGSLRLPPDQNPDQRDTGITGVRREWRRRGIAQALKWQGIRYAKEAGAKRLKTWNASDNLPVLELNRKLGFVREPWRIHFVKDFGSEDVS